MDSLFSAATQQYEGQEFMDFLLESMPLYARATYASPHELPDLATEFAERFCNAMPTRAAPVRHAESQVVTRRGCPECGHVEVVLDSEVAGLVCSICGLQGRTGFDHPYQDRTYVNPSRPYTYQANKYLQSLMDCVQGFYAPGCVKQVLPELREDLCSHGILSVDISPTNTYDALRRCKHSKLLRHRWRITQLLNSDYLPLHIPHDRQMAVQNLFAGCYQQFLLRKGTRRRKFYSYPLFLKAALRFIGCADLDIHFTPLKNLKNERQQLKEIQNLLNVLLGGRTLKYACG